MIDVILLELEIGVQVQIIVQYLRIS